MLAFIVNEMGDCSQGVVRHDVNVRQLTLISVSRIGYKKASIEAG